MIDVGDETLNLALTLLFIGIFTLALLSILPWRALGLTRISMLARWIWVGVLTMAVAYEVLMPSRFDIRIDLLLLLPVYCVVVLSTLVRWWSWARVRNQS